MKKKEKFMFIKKREYERLKLQIENLEREKAELKQERDAINNLDFVNEQLKRHVLILQNQQLHKEKDNTKKVLEVLREIEE